MNNNIIRNEYGYFQLANMPSDEELKKFYETEYFQKNISKSYSSTYTEEELNYFDAKNQQKEILAGDFESFLDVGCGEGYVLSYFDRRCYEVLGMEYDSYSINQHNPSLVDKCLFGDVFSNLKKMKRKFDIVNLDNVLEHTPHPKELLELCFAICNKKIIIKVPNDFSVFQKYCVRNNITRDRHWVITPDHVNYFNKEGLITLCNSIGFKNEKILGNYLTEFFILHELTNYIENQSLGKSCHFARVKEELLLNEISPLKTIEFYEVLGDMGLGREIIYVGKK